MARHHSARALAIVVRMSYSAPSDKCSSRRLRRISLVLLAFLVAASCGAADTATSASDIAISVVIPRKEHGERTLSSPKGLTLMHSPSSPGDHVGEPRDTNAHFYVVVSNTSNKPQRIWQEWCSWGYFGLTFELSDETGKKWVAKKNGGWWTMNFPSYWRLDPEDSVVIEVHFEKALQPRWEGFPLPEDGEKTVTMRAVFQFEPDEESKKADVWTGLVASKPQRVTFYPGGKPWPK